MRNDLRPNGSSTPTGAQVPDHLLPGRGTPVHVMYVDDTFFEIL
jgi:hypothetical protein